MNLNEKWDVIVIGTGIGGATIGYQLAKAGKKVLFLEKGRSHLSSKDHVAGDYPENLPAYVRGSEAARKTLLQNSGRADEPFCDVSTNRPISFIPFVGCGTGGSSTLYGGVLERFQPFEFGAGDTNSWPFTYSEIAPYYEQAENLYRVHPRDKDGADFSNSSPATREMASFFERKGLQPRRLPLARGEGMKCTGCQGYICSHHEKGDSAAVCLEPALHDYHGQLWDECEVLKIESQREDATALICRRKGAEERLTGNVIILAAGAFESPRLLLRSASADWPQGLANHSGMVGANLMRHFIDIYLIFTRHKPNLSRNPKEIGISAFADGTKGDWGVIQNFGSLPPARVMFSELDEDLRTSAFFWLRPILMIFRPLMEHLMDKIVSRGTLFATIMEDKPELTNRVTVAESSTDIGNGKICFQYRIGPSGKKRIELFRAAMKEILKPYRYMLFKQAESNKRLGHACGTCRAGLDPIRSVVDKFNRAHGLRNLYIVDSSFFPSSGTTNPGLTIAANALRVADHILSTWGSEGRQSAGKGK